ncbi:hypothetical protein BBK82_14040 [Lentzea guizhouensis]|uniref:Uncharacterized protein n=1 Tax=Lentzea guizhouensis TaxID=1586287 RepID=A0A1B2HH42_9PSEU|nr:hypothetical protein [Lentzea guizhouensis]ANZ37023.1 hypothetical protein BBK82_14040 [Lentzea guizhouensis]
MKKSNVLKTVVAAVVTGTTTATVTNADQPQAVRRADDRPGYGALKLGMTLDEVRAAGLTQLSWGGDDAQVDAGCAADEQIAVSKKYGIERITLPIGANTPKGIGVGSTFADVKKAHPDAKEYRAGYSASIGSAHYAFLGIGSAEHYQDSDEVLVIKLSTNAVDCPMAAL